MQHETTCREFLEWQEFLDKEEWVRTHHGDYYLAQIACEIARWRVKNPGSLKIEDFLLKFVTRGEHAVPVSQDVLERRTQLSKAKWHGIARVGGTKGADRARQAAPAPTAAVNGHPAPRRPARG